MDGETYGTINFSSPAIRRRRFTETDREIIKQFAEWVGTEIARNRDIEELRAAKAELERIARTDELTGVFNRREVLRRAEQEYRKYRRYRDGFSVLIFDIDKFKTINDTLGHAVGDGVLRRIAKLAEGELRDGDIFGRIGGEEFCSLLVKADARAAYATAERLRKRIAADATLAGQAGRPVTVSVGVACVRPSDKNFAQVLERADRALYWAKDAGRNQTCMFGSGPADEVAGG